MLQPVPTHLSCFPWHTEEMRPTALEVLPFLACNLREGHIGVSSLLQSDWDPEHQQQVMFVSLIAGKDCLNSNKR